MAKLLCAQWMLQVFSWVFLLAGCADTIGTGFVYKELKNARPFVCWSGRSDSYCGDIPVNPFPPYPFSPKDITRNNSVFCSVHDSASPVWRVCDLSSAAFSCLVNPANANFSIPALLSSGFLRQVEEHYSKDGLQALAITKLILGLFCVYYGLRDIQKDKGKVPQARDDPNCCWHGCKCCCRVSICCVTQYLFVVCDMAFAVVLYMLNHGFFKVDCDESVFAPYKSACNAASSCGVHTQGVVSNPEALQLSTNLMLIFTSVQFAATGCSLIKKFCCITPGEHASLARKNSQSSGQLTSQASSLQLTAQSQSFHVPAPSPAQYASQPVAVAPQYAVANPYTMQSASYPMQPAPVAYPMQPVMVGSAPGAGYYPQMQSVQFSPSAGQQFVYVRPSM